MWVKFLVTLKSIRKELYIIYNVLYDAKKKNNTVSKTYYSFVYAILRINKERLAH